MVGSATTEAFYRCSMDESSGLCALGAAHSPSGIDGMLPGGRRHGSVVGGGIVHQAVDRSSANGFTLRTTLPHEAVVSLALELGLVQADSAGGVYGYDAVQSSILAAGGGGRGSGGGGGLRSAGGGVQEGVVPSDADFTGGVPLEQLDGSDLMAAEPSTRAGSCYYYLHQSQHQYQHSPQGRRHFEPAMAPNGLIQEGQLEQGPQRSGPSLSQQLPVQAALGQPSSLLPSPLAPSHHHHHHLSGSATPPIRCVTRAMELPSPEAPSAAAQGCGGSSPRRQLSQVWDGRVAEKEAVTQPPPPPALLLWCGAVEARLRDWYLQARLSWKVFSDIVRRKPWILLVPLLLCGLLSGLGVFGVVYAADRDVSSQKAYAQEAVASTTAGAIAGQLEIATFAIMSMSAYLTLQPFCAELNHTFYNLSDTIMSWDEQKLVYQIQALPAALLNYIYPPVTGDLAKQLIGRDLLQVEQYRNDTIYQISRRNQQLMLGPYNLLEGFKGMFVTYPVFLPAPGPLYDWGCNVQPYMCPEGLCWIAEQGLKLWGLVTSVVSLDNMQGSFQLSGLTGQGYLYRLRQEPDEVNRAAVIAVSTPPPQNAVVASVRKFNLFWVLEVSPADGWQPSWRNPCIVAVVLGSAAVSLLVLWVLVTQEKHNMLLQAMLPRKIIWRLQRGEQTVVEEFLEPVTILFSDIVSYTEVASKLTPLQVVRLLNELYTQFDALCDKHGVYKVETIGDAFMCVSGCPIREDPVKAAVRMAGMAQDMISMVERFSTRVGQQEEEMRVKIRIGMHSGPVVAGVIGQRMPRYCLFGDTVNTASRMETNSQPMCIHISAATASLLRRAGASVVLPPKQPPARLVTLPSPLNFSRISLSNDAPAGGPAANGAVAANGGTAAACGGDAAANGAAAAGTDVLMTSPLNLSLFLEQHDRLSCDAGALAAAAAQRQRRERASRPTPAATSEVASPGPTAPLVLYGRGRVHIKGKGLMHTFWLGARPPPTPTPPTPQQPSPRPGSHSGLASNNGPAPGLGSSAGLGTAAVAAMSAFTAAIASKLSSGGRAGAGAGNGAGVSGITGSSNTASSAFRESRAALPAATMMPSSGGGVVASAGGCGRASAGAKGAAAATATATAAAAVSYGLEVNTELLTLRCGDVSGLFMDASTAAAAAGAGSSGGGGSGAVPMGAAFISPVSPGATADMDCSFRGEAMAAAELAAFRQRSHAQLTFSAGQFSFTSGAGLASQASQAPLPLSASESRVAGAQPGPAAAAVAVAPGEVAIVVERRPE